MSPQMCTALIRWFHNPSSTAAELGVEYRTTKALLKRKLIEQVQRVMRKSPKYRLTDAGVEAYREALKR